MEPVRCVPAVRRVRRRAELDGRGKRAVVVGCGLGADATFAAGLGYRTLAFDIAPSAVEQARSRTAGSGVEFQVADLLDLPGRLAGRFDLVIEIFTVQAMPPELHQRAAVQVASLVAPGGLLVAIGAIADDDAATLDGPPLPLTPPEIDAFRIPGPARTRIRPDVRRRRSAVAAGAHQRRRLTPPQRPVMH